MIETERVISKDAHIQIYATVSIDGRLAYAHSATPSMHRVRVEAGRVHRITPVQDIIHVQNTPAFHTWARSCSTFSCTIALSWSRPSGGRWMEGSPFADSRAAILACRSLVFTPRYRQDIRATTDRRAARAVHGGTVQAQRCPAGLGSSEPGSRPPPFPAWFFTSIVEGSAASASPPTLYHFQESWKERKRTIPPKFSLGGCTTSWRRSSRGAEMELRFPQRRDQQTWTILSAFFSPPSWEWKAPSVRTGGKKVKTGMKPCRLALLDPQRTDTSERVLESGRPGSKGQSERRSEGPPLALATEHPTCCVSVSLPYFYLFSVFPHADLFAT